MDWKKYYTSICILERCQKQVCKSTESGFEEGIDLQLLQYKRRVLQGHRDTLGMLHLCIMLLILSLIFLRINSTKITILV